MNDHKPKILVVEDEHHIALGIIENLELEGYAPTLVEDGQAGLAAIESQSHDLVLLDVMLPKMDGFEVCRRARAAGVRTPILFLTARGGLDDRIQGLQAGGDDYLPKPFHLDELLIRVQAMLRRHAWSAEAGPQGVVARFGGNEVDLINWRATGWDNQTHILSEKEALLLKALWEHQGEVLTREDILEKVWGYDVFPSTRAIEALAQRLCKRFERTPNQPKHITTVRGVGYRLDVG